MTEALLGLWRRLCLRPPWRYRRNDLPRERKSARDDNKLSVPGPAHSEYLVISFLKCSQDVRRGRATIGLRRAPANDNALADVSSCEVNRQSVPHARHLSWDLQRPSWWPSATGAWTSMIHARGACWGASPSLHRVRITWTSQPTDGPLSYPRSSAGGYLG
jgi:hypothetical protein